MYNFEYLRMFVETAETGSFSACARKLGKAQSAVSQGIANLEVDFGFDIFDRSSRRAVLTNEGERLLKYAKVVLQQTRELNAAAQSIVRNEEQSITIAIDNALQTPSFSKVMFQFSQTFSATEIEVLTVASPDIVSLVENGRVDIGLMLSDMSFSREVDLSYIGNIQLCATCSPQHSLASRENIDIAELAGFTQMMLRGENKGTIDYEAAISAHSWQSNNVNLLIDLIVQGIGWGYLPVHLVKPYINDGKLVEMAMRLDEKLWSPSVDMVTQKNRASGVGLNWLSTKFKTFLDTQP